MRHSDQVLIMDEETGSLKLQELAHFLPMYMVTEVVSYNIGNGTVGPVTIVGIDMSINFDKEKNVYLTETIYRTDDGMLVEEDEIELYYEEIEEEVVTHDDV